MNIGLWIYNVSVAVVNLGSKLAEVFNKEISIKWISTVINYFGGDLGLPDTISLSYLLMSSSAALIITFIIYRLVK